MPSPEEVRAQFPALAGGFAFLDNAGGAQVPGAVADAVRSYMVETYVQVGGRYPQSVRATETVERAREFTSLLMGGQDGVVALGPSTSALLRHLGDAIGLTLRPGDELVVAESNHEANIGPWVRLERLGARVVWWQPDPETGLLRAKDLDRLLTDRTRVVALPHASNILGAEEDLAGAVVRAHSVGALVVADGVAYAPHRRMRVSDWGADFYAFSCYKVFGPHLAALWGRREAMEGLTGPNHFFLPKEPVCHRWELGGVDHEACAGWLQVGGYLAFLAGSDVCDAGTVDSAYAEIQRLEAEPMEFLLDFLRTRPGVSIVGPRSFGPGRLPTVSFVSRRAANRDLVDAAARAGLGIKHGHFYAYRLMEALGLEPQEGVTRVSLAHYNTAAEVSRLCAALEPLLG